MNSQLFTQLVVGVILVIGALVSAYLVPPIKNWLVTKVGAQQMEDFVGFVKKCVEWANQTIPEEEWKRKKQEVTNMVVEYVEKHTGLDLTDGQIDAIIEALVYSVKHKD